MRAHGNPLFLNYAIMMHSIEAIFVSGLVLFFERLQGPLIPYVVFLIGITQLCSMLMPLVVNLIYDPTQVRGAGLQILFDRKDFWEFFQQVSRSQTVDTCRDWWDSTFLVCSLSLLLKFLRQSC